MGIQVLPLKRGDGEPLKVTAKPSLEQYESSYLAWLQALKLSLQEKPEPPRLSVPQAVMKTITEILGTPPNDTQVGEFKSEHVRNWFTRKSLPSDRFPVILDALIKTVEANVGKHPKGALPNLGFEEVVNGLKELRASRQAAGRSQAKKSIDLHSQEIVTVPAVAAKSLDTKALTLGSWLVDGDIPPYVSRVVDAKVLKAMNNSSNELIVLTGEPKSGKTRTLVEALKRSKHANSTIYWVSPTRGAVGALIKKLRIEKKMGSVIVLDDLQDFAFDAADGITSQRLADLCMRGLVVATLHSSTLSNWESSPKPRKLVPKTGPTSHWIESNSHFGPSTSVLAQISSGRIDLDLTLGANEMKAAMTVDPYTSCSKEDVSKLASFLASVDFLKGVALEMMTGASPIEEAIVCALFDSCLLNLDGISLAELKKLTLLNLERIAPNKPWNDSAWERALDKITSGSSRQSPHSLITRTSLRGEKFKIMDAVKPALKPATWSEHHLGELTEQEMFTLAKALVEHEDLLDSFDRITMNLIRMNPSVGVMVFADLSNDSGDSEMYEYWLRVAVMHGSVDGMFALGNILRESELDEDAEELFLEASKRGHVKSMTNLGVHLFEKGLDDGAEIWWRQAMANNDLFMAPHNLAILLAKKGQDVESQDLLIQAAELGNLYSQTELARRASERGEFSDAQFWHQKGADLGDPIAMLNLGTLLQKAGDLVNAEIWWRKAAELGDVDAHFNLGGLFQESGDLKNAESWWKKAAELGDVDAHVNLGGLFQNSGDLKNAESWWKKAAEIGHRDAWTYIGLMKYNSGDLVGAEAEWLQAARLGESAAHNNLASLYWDLGETEKAEVWYKKAIALGYAPAHFNLGSMYHELGDPRKAKLSWKKAAELGDLNAIEHLRSWQEKSEINREGKKGPIERAPNSRPETSARRGSVESPNLGSKKTKSVELTKKA